jgi:small subunit ribosomal protein S17
MAEETQEDLNPVVDESAAVDSNADETPVAAAPAGDAAVVSESANATKASQRGNRAQKIGVVSSDKMQKTVVVRVDRLIKHPKYRRYVRRTSKFMAHDETGATVGDKVKIVETRPLSAHKRWRVVEIIQKAAK